MNIVSIFGRLSLTTIAPSLIRNVSITAVRNFQTTPCLFAEPLKKKRRIDPAVVKARDERKKKKIEKQIRRLEKNARQLKPIEECEIPLHLSENKEFYTRKNANVSAELQEQRILLEKRWAKYKGDQHLADIQMLDRIMFSQQLALDELRKESEELYQEAIQVDLSLIPFKCDGPVHTAKIEDYDPQDGDYLDVSRKW